MIFKFKSTFFSTLIVLSGVANAAANMQEIETKTELGWDVIALHRVCAKYDESSGHDLIAVNAEASLFRYVRLSKLVKNTYPEVHTRKVWLREQVNSAAYSYQEQTESRAAVIAECKKQIKHSKEFVKSLGLPPE
ncbi:hypothetical protein DIC66_22480 [Rhodoferax lacus]|uniref:Uncharacterized protein n=1 Tax=Rhodoferax lacus TaxID=2184758 RepID=A0A3E1R5L6_9BURK|nr:hypothetical protein [Rhodoferax lacus]RFO94646.1 hypothetical protein DIC66_22480 [Rhodoferax lacus]